MNSQDLSQSNNGIFLTVTLIAVSLLIFLIWQLTVLSGQRNSFILSRLQLDQSLTINTPQHEQMIKQAHEVQSKLEKIANELLNLADDGDPDAKALVAKFKISKVSPTPSPSPAQ